LIREKEDKGKSNSFQNMWHFWLCSISKTKNSTWNIRRKIRKEIIQTSNRKSKIKNQHPEEKKGDKRKAACGSAC